MPQNQTVKEQWGVLEASQEQVVRLMHFLEDNPVIPKEEEDEFPCPGEDQK